MKKLLIFLMISIPLVIILILNITIEVVVGDLYIAVDKIELNKTSIVANVDEKFTLTTKIYPENATNKGVMWESDNENVVEVDENGNVSFVGFGKGYVTATTNDGNKRASCYFYVTDTKVHQVILHTSQKTIATGKTLQLSYTILPDEALNKDVVFTSSDEDIAKVDSNGLVYGLKAGNVDITVTTVDGNYFDKTTISVYNPVTSIVLDETSALISKSYYQIGYTIYPENATHKDVVFTSSDEDIATVNQYGVVTFKKAGKVDVSATTVDGGFNHSMTIECTDGYAKELIVEDYSINVTVGDKPFLIRYNILPMDYLKSQVYFKSENEEVAVVDNSGYIHAIAGGNTIINLKMNISETEFIERQILVYVESPAKDIDIKDEITAEKNITLVPKSLPVGSTNDKFFYHSENENVATVDNNGNVTFKTDIVSDVNIIIYANEDNSDVYKKVNILYTAGKATDYQLLTEELILDYKEVKNLNCKFIPENTTIRNVQVELIGASTNEEDNIVKILSDGSIIGQRSGEGKLNVSLVLYNGIKKSYQCIVKVQCSPKEININLDLEKYEGQYITAENQVILNGEVLPYDKNNDSIKWAVDDKDIAVIIGNTLTFNKVGTVALTASCGEIQNAVMVRYTGSYPISAELGAMQNGILKEIPSILTSGESFEVVLKSIFPSNTINKNIVLQVVNQETLNSTGTVLKIDKENKVTAVGGGSATLIVYVSSYFQTHFDIEVQKIAESLDVLNKDIKITKDTLNLISEVLPRDTTDKTVRYEILNDNIASIKNNVLTFKQNGIAQIKAVSNSNPELFINFTIEKIEKEAIVIKPNQTNLDAFIGDLIYFDLAEYKDTYDKQNISIVSQNPTFVGDSVAEIIDNKIKIKSTGDVKLSLQLSNTKTSQTKTFLLNIKVLQFVEDIIFNTDIDFYNDEYVLAKDSLNLNFEVLPNHATNKDYSIKILQSFTNNGIEENIAYISENKMYFTKQGTILLEVKSKDGNVTKNFRIKYTGGNAISAEINLESPIYMEIGEEISVFVTKWLPKDTINNIVLLREIAHTQGVDVVKIDNKTNKITALSGGRSRILIEISDGITREIVVNVIKRVTSIHVDEEHIISANDKVSIRAQALPSSATTKTLTYKIEENDIAYLEENVVIFNKAGSVKVVISTIDGSNITKEIIVTSTMGYLSEIVLNTDNKNLNKNSNFILYIVQKYPVDSIYNDVQFNIVENKAIDGSDNQVVSLNEEGLVTGLYGGYAVIRASSIDYYGNEVYTDCRINVINPVKSIDVAFDSNPDKFQNSIIISRNELEFRKVFNPIDATNTEFEYVISEPSIAKIEDNKIVFLKNGKVIIKFISKDKTFGEKSKTLTFYYSDNDLFKAELDKSDMVDNTLTIKAGSSYKFKTSVIIPKDMVNLTYTTNNFEERRIDTAKSVGHFENDIFYAENGGKVSFKLFINNIEIGDFTIIVLRDATGIGLEEGNTIYVSQPSYNIKASALPSDTYQHKLIYSIDDTSTALVNNDGSVEFFKLGVVKVTISLVDNSDIKEIVTIEYTKDLKSIKFNLTKDKMYVGEYVDLSVIPNPIDANSFDYELTADDESKVTIIKRSNGYRIIGQKDGKVVITAKVKDKDIKVSKEFVFYSKITDIQLELDKVNDVNGHGAYRYFGVKTLSPKDNTYQISNKYKMNVSLKPSNSLTNLLKWETSDETIAKVNQDGVVEFLKPGKVTITVSQIPPYQDAKVVYDSYEFKIVDGINVSNYNEYIFAHWHFLKTNKDKTDNYSAIVLHNNIISDSKIFNATFYLDYNVYGNGYLLDLSNISSYVKSVIRKSNITIDNVIMRGNAFNPNSALSDLREKGLVILIEGQVDNILLYNSIFENASSCVKIDGSKVLVEGCIIRNSYSASMLIQKGGEEHRVSEVTIRDTIFSNSLLCGILFNYETTETSNEPNILNLEGNVMFYNWLTLEEMEHGFMGHLEQIMAGYGFALPIIKDAFKQIKEIMYKFSDYRYNYNGKDYYNFGVFQFYADLAGKVFKSSAAKIDRSLLNPNCNYSDLSIKGVVSAAQGVTNVDFKVDLLTLSNINPFIRPGDTYEGNQYILSLVRKPSRI